MLRKIVKFNVSKLQLLTLLTELPVSEQRKNDIPEELHLMVRTDLNLGNAYKC